MEKQFAVSEVRRLSNRIPRSNDEIADAQEALRAFADMLEAQEKAVPVAYYCEDAGDGMPDLGFTRKCDFCAPLYAHPAPSDAERLAEALRMCMDTMLEHGVPTHPDADARVAYTDAEQALAAHSTQAQSPAASVPEALRLLQSVLCDTDGNCCIRGTYEDRRTVDKALAMLAAQENLNG